MEYEPHFSPESTDKDDKDSADKKKDRRSVLPPSITLGTEKVERVLASESSLHTKLFERERPEPKELSKPETLAERTISGQQELDDSNTESDPTLEHLDDTERRQITEQYITVVLPEVAAEMQVAAVDSAESLEAAADAALLSELQTRLPDAVTPEAALSGAYDAVVQTLESTASDATQELLENEVKNSRPENNIGPVTPEAGIPNTAETTTSDAEDTSAAPVSSGPMPPPPPSFRTTATPMPFPANRPSQAFNAVRSVSSPSAETITSVESSHRERAAAGRGLLVGGILGYLLGRRRGRIKTEKRLMPIQKKLEKQVKDLHQTIAIKEQQVRKLAAQKTEAVSVNVTHAETIRQLRHNHIDKSAEAAITGPTLVQSAERRATGVAPSSMERIVGQPAEKMTSAEAERASIPVLLAVAETISVGNQSLQHMYETHQLSERSLRVAVREHLRGGNVHEVVARELIAQELPFEREPSSTVQATNSSATTRVSSSVTANAEDRTILPAPATQYSASDRALLSTKSMPAQRNSHTATLGIATILALAIALALVVLLR